MNTPAQSAAPAVETAELQQALERLLSAACNTKLHVTDLERKPWPYASSFPLEEIVVAIRGREPVRLIFKNLGPRTLSAEARRAKPQFLDDPLREIVVYEQLLAESGLGTPRCYGSVVDEAAGRFWLFLEAVEGPALFEVGDFEIWRQAARWLARLHTHYCDSSAVPVAAATHLVRFDAPYVGRWLERARQFESQRPRPERDHRLRMLEPIAKNYPVAMRELLNLPFSLIHGEFYASNVLVQVTPAGQCVCPIDWERAALAPGLVDLAALTAGSWSEEQKLKLAQAYYAELRDQGATALEWNALVRGFHVCRLFLAVQWLGWSDCWQPPRAHRQDWLAEATRAAQFLK